MLCRTTLSGIALVVTVACGSTDDSDANGSDTDCTSRFEERLDDACVPVSVTGMTERDVVIDNDGVLLQGTLALPTTAGSYQAPGAIIIHGSGPQDRDGHATGALGVSFGTEIEVYRSLAEQLAMSGIAVLRYEKRTCFTENNSNCSTSLSSSSVNPNDVLVDDFAADAAVAARLLASQSRTAVEANSPRS